MDIQTRKIDFVQEFLKIQNEELLSSLELLLRSNMSEINSKKITVEGLNIRINKSIDDANNNLLTSSDDLIVEIEKWA